MSEREGFDRRRFLEETWEDPLVLLLRAGDADRLLSPHELDRMLDRS